MAVPSLCVAWAVCVVLICGVASAGAQATRPIDRRAVVGRHNVVVTQFDPLTPITVGNGEFAFTADVTGLQTFPEAYEKGTPLCTMSHWGWHSFPMPEGMDPKQFRYADYDTYGRPVGYATSKTGQEGLFNYLRDNPHRLHLGRIGLELKKRDGSPVVVGDVKIVRQELDLWTGVVTSRFEVEGVPVEVRTCCPGALDAVAATVDSPLVADGRCGVVVDFPYGSPKTVSADWGKPEAHKTGLSLDGRRADFVRTVDSTEYHVGLRFDDGGALTQEGPHRFRLGATPGGSRLSFVCAFGNRPVTKTLPSSAAAFDLGRRHWEEFWNSGGAVDLSGSTDPRWKELERRIVLSQYVTAVNNGSLPPAETGLVYNSWNGKFHLEMHWWHAAHFALWDRTDLLERSLGYYPRILPVAREIARRQGYEGARWPKMVGPDGHDSPSPIGPLLIWQQPHPIYYAELCYRGRKDRATLERWREVVDSTADFMASYAVKDPATGKYVLGPPLKTVPEHADTMTSKNPAFELAYWRFGLGTAIEWHKRLGVARNPKWQEVLADLAPLPEADGVYLMQDGMTDTYTAWNWEHPSVTGCLGVLPGDGVDPATMRRTVERVMATWKWDDCWGWDFPMMAMGAARSGRPDLAVDALLMDVPKNRYLVNGNNYQRPNLTLYLPGNGGLLSAVAMMAAGWDGAPDGVPAPGFPKEGWDVKWEGLRRMP
jgi:hypothetical protein